MTNTPVFPQTANNNIQQFLPADTNGAGTAKVIFTPGANGSYFDALLVSSSDTSARDLVICFFISATLYEIATISLPITSGFVNSVPCVDILRHTQFPGLTFDAFGNRVLMLKSTTTIKAYMGATITAAKAVNIFAQGRDF